MVIQEELGTVGAATYIGYLLFEYALSPSKFARIL